MPKMTEQGLRAIVQSEVAQAFGFIGAGSLLSNARRQAMQYYLAQPYGNEQEDRSQVVTTEVRDTIETALPHLVNLFTAGDKVVQFDPAQPGDEARAAQATDYVNYVFLRDNPGFMLLYTMFKDALLQKTGVVKHWWENKERVKPPESYTGLTDDEVAELVTDDEVEVLSHDSYPAPQSALAALTPPQAPQMPAGAPPAPGGPMGAPQPPMPPQGLPAAPGAINPSMPAPAEPPTLHDITIRRTVKEGRVRLMAIPPEEFGISRRARDLITAPLTYHRVKKTLGQLREDYPDADKKGLLDTLASGDIQDYNQESIERRSTIDENATTADTQGTVDPSMREVWLYECYIWVDYDGDGKSELRKVTMAGDNGPILENEEWDEELPPFSAITPIPQTHMFYGLSMADLVMDLQLIRSTVMRQALDNMYLINNARVELPEQAIGDNTIDDLLTPRPGGVVRTRLGGQMHMMEVQSIAPVTMPILEMLEGEKQNRTGIVPFKQALDPETLQGTATGQNLMNEASVQRIELIARVFAETGLKDMFRAILRLICRHQDVARTIRLRDKWIEMDPRSWDADMDCVVNVGLGDGTRVQAIQAINSVLGMQKEAIMAGMSNIAGPEQVYNALAKFCELSGLKRPDGFFTDPATVPPPQPQPHPEVQKIQAQIQGQMQIKHAELQSQAQLTQMKMQSDQAREKAQMDADLQVNQHKAQVDAQLKQLQSQVDEKRAAEKMHMEMLRLQGDMQIQRERLAMEREIKMQELAMKYGKSGLDQAAAAADIELKRSNSVLNVANALATAQNADINAMESMVGSLDTLHGVHIAAREQNVAEVTADHSMKMAEKQANKPAPAPKE